MLAPPRVTDPPTGVFSDTGAEVEAALREQEAQQRERRATIVVLGAGGPAGVNTCRAFSAAGHRVIGLDENRYHLVWAREVCAKVALSPPAGDGLLKFVESFEPDLVHAQPEPAVLWLAEHSWLPSLMPEHWVIGRMQDKLATARRWVAADLREHGPIEMPAGFLPDYLHMAAERFGLPFWLRATRGAGARGATLVEDLRTGFHWVRYWQTRNSAMEFVAEQYLPGRDFCWSSLWRDGELLAAFARERLEWIYPHLAPSGRTGTPSVSITVHDERVNEVGQQAVRVIDLQPNGLYMVDMREDADGVPRPTEINAGRFATTTPLYSALGPSLPALYVRAALGEQVEPLGNDIHPADQLLVRHIDAGTYFLPSDALP